MNKISNSSFCFSLNIPFLLELCFLAEVMWVEICVSHRLNYRWAALRHRSSSSSGSQKVWGAVSSSASRSLIKHLFLFCQQPNEMCGNVFAFHNPRLSLSSRIPCSSYTAQINLSSRHKSIFFSSQVSHTHTRADSALRADTCWPQSPTPLLHSLFHHSTVKVFKHLSLSVRRLHFSSLSSGSQRWERTLPSSS